MKKVVLILIDGMTPEAIAACGSADAAWLLSRSSYTLQGRTVYPSVTLPCHMSLFHSVEPARHGVTTNVFTPQVRPVTGLCEQLRQFSKKNAFFWSWGELKDLFRPDSLAYGEFVSGHLNTYEGATRILLSHAVDYIRREQSDFTFFYIGTPDEAGHASGWMEKDYLRAVRDAFQISRTLVESLPAGYVTIITADHGGHGRMHGTQEESDMVIPVIMHGLGTGIDLDQATILDIAPTVAKLLEVPCVEAWEGQAIVE